MRIAVAGFAHESNTFYSQPTRLGDFGVCEGEAILSHYANTFHEIAGYIAGAEQFGYDIFPIVAAGATPAAAVEWEAYEHFGADTRRPARRASSRRHTASVARGYGS